MQRWPAYSSRRVREGWGVYRNVGEQGEERRGRRRERDCANGWLEPPFSFERKSLGGFDRQRGIVQEKKERRDI